MSSMFCLNFDYKKTEKGKFYTHTTRVEFQLLAVITVQALCDEINISSPYGTCKT